MFQPSIISGAVPFYTALAAGNAAALQQAAGAIETIHPALGEALLPTTEAAAHLYIKGADTFQRDLLGLRQTPHATLSPNTLRTLVGRFSDDHLRSMRAEIIAARKDPSKTFQNSDPAVLQQLGAFLLYREKREGISSKVHAGVSIFTAGGIAITTIARVFFESQIRDHYKMLVKAGIELDFGQYIDLCWLNDFLQPIGFGAITYILFSLWKQERQTTISSVRIFTFLALAFSLQEEAHHFEGTQYSVFGRGQFDPMDVAISIASFLLACRLVTLAWIPKRS